MAYCNLPIVELHLIQILLHRISVNRSVSAMHVQLMIANQILDVQRLQRDPWKSNIQVAPFVTEFHDCR